MPVVALYNSFVDDRIVHRNRKPYTVFEMDTRNGGAPVEIRFLIHDWTSLISERTEHKRVNRVFQWYFPQYHLLFSNDIADLLDFSDAKQKSRLNWPKKALCVSAISLPRFFTGHDVSIPRHIRCSILTNVNHALYMRKKWVEPVSQSGELSGKKYSITRIKIVRSSPVVIGIG